jgi:hypothetical protein
VPRSIWNGAVSVAGIDVPAKIFAATDPKGVRFRELQDPEGAGFAHEMDSSRASVVLGWKPQRDAGAALLELLEGISSSARLPTPTLQPGGDGRLRAREFLTAIGARGPGSSG